MLVNYFKRSIFLIFAFVSACASVPQIEKAIIVTSPQEIPKHTKAKKIFLGGSIEMGKAEDWQQHIINEFEDQNVILLNPRRKDWNPKWKPELSNPNFKQQVEWELDALEQADVIIMYLSPNTQSPISLMEIGLYAKTGKLIVYCPEGFWRKGNVDALSIKYGVKTVNSFEELVIEAKSRIK